MADQNDTEQEKSGLPAEVTGNTTDDGVKEQDWAKTADLHTGDEPGEAEREERRAEEVEEGQPDGPMGQEHVDQIEEMEDLKRKVSEEAVARHTHSDFQVGGVEEPYLRGGVPAEVAFAAREERFAKIRKEEGLQDPDEADEQAESARQDMKEAAQKFDPARKGPRPHQAAAQEDSEDEDEV